MPGNGQQEGNAGAAEWDSNVVAVVVELGKQLAPPAAPAAPALLTGVHSLPILPAHPQVLQEVPLEVLPLPTCRRMYGSEFPRLDWQGSTMLCAGELGVLLPAPGWAGRDLCWRGTM